MPTAPENPTTEQYYLAQAALGGFVASQVAAAPVDLDPLDLAGTFGDLQAVAAGIGAEYALAAIGDAADYYADFRLAQGVRDGFRVPIVNPPTIEAVERKLESAAAELLDAVDFVVDELYLAELTAQIQAEAEAIARDAVLGAGRGQVFAAISSDPVATGWARVTRAGACSFCRMLAMRGPVFSEASANFRAHVVINGRGGVCQCTAEPIIRDSYKQTDQQAADAATWQKIKDAGFVGRDARNEFRRSIEGRADGRRILPADTKRVGGKRPREIQGQRPGFDFLTPAQLELHLSVLVGLKDSEYRTKQMARIRSRLLVLGVTPA